MKIKFVRFYGFAYKRDVRSIRDCIERFMLNDSFGIGRSLILNEYNKK